LVGLFYWIVLVTLVLLYDRRSHQKYEYPLAGGTFNNLAEMLAEEPEKAAYWQNKAIEQSFVHTRAVVPWH
jgi:hypothetical protein